MIQQSVVKYFDGNKLICVKQVTSWHDYFLTVNKDLSASLFYFTDPGRRLLDSVVEKVLFCFLLHCHCLQNYYADCVNLCVSVTAASATSDAVPCTASSQHDQWVGRSPLTDAIQQANFPGSLLMKRLYTRIAEDDAGWESTLNVSFRSFNGSTLSPNPQNQNRAFYL